MKYKTALALFLCALSTVSCTRLSEVGRGPQLSPIEDPRETMEEARVVSLPMPPQQEPRPNSSSLWQASPNGFFGDHRASQIGDILTVTIDIRDNARMRNETQRSRSAGESAGIPGFFGLEEKIIGAFGGEASADSLVDLSSTSSTAGSGQVNRNEEIRLKLAAIVTDVLPNGNLAISGRQEIRVNSELRELRIAGVIRPKDITASNTVAYDQIAEARISYGGRGIISDVQRPRIGQEIYDIIMPW